MKVTLSCSWCHEPNDASLVGRKVYCWSCAHRADVPRVQCDCRKCRFKDRHVPVETRKGAAA